MGTTQFRGADEWVYSRARTECQAVSSFAQDHGRSVTSCLAELQEQERTEGTYPRAAAAGLAVLPDQLRASIDELRASIDELRASIDELRASIQEAVEDARRSPVRF